MTDESTEKENVLYVKTFGGFHVRFNGVEIAEGDQRGNQGRMLMQLMLHYKNNGVSRDTMKSTLFEDRDIDDVSHAIRNLLYNTRKRLKELGLPDGEYIKQEKGVYYWTGDVEAVEDADEFEKVYVQAKAEEDVKKKVDLFQKCIMMYSGRFLAGQDSVVWVFREAERYRQMFHECVEYVCDYMREIHRFKTILRIGEYAVSVDPFAEWEVRVLEGLTETGQYSEAERYYDDTVDAYISEYGNKSNEYVRDLIKKLGAYLFYQNDTIDEIQEKLKNDDDSAHHGYYCSLPVFQELYRTVERTMERAGEKIFLMLCTIVDSKGNPMREGPKLDELSERLREAIIQSVRRTDTITKYGKGQYLVLLINTTKENCAIIEKHINSNYLQRRQRTGVAYSVNGIIIQSKELPQR